MRGLLYLIVGLGIWIMGLVVTTYEGWNLTNGQILLKDPFLAPFVFTSPFIGMGFILLAIARNIASKSEATA